MESFVESPEDMISLDDYIPIIRFRIVTFEKTIMNATLSSFIDYMIT